MSGVVELRFKSLPTNLLLEGISAYGKLLSRWSFDGGYGGVETDLEQSIYESCRRSK